MAVNLFCLGSRLDIVGKREKAPEKGDADSLTRLLRACVIIVVSPAPIVMIAISTVNDRAAKRRGAGDRNRACWRQVVNIFGSDRP